MSTTVKRVDAALRRRNLRHAVGVIERNPAAPGEVVICTGGYGIPVTSCRQAVALASGIEDERDWEYERSQP